MQAGAVSAILGGPVDLNKTTGGTVTLSGANTYTGTTTVSGGTLNLGGGQTLNVGGAGFDWQGGTLRDAVSEGPEAPHDDPQKQPAPICS